MADVCCDDIVGGEVYITWGDKRYEAIGDVNILPARISREANATQGGRMYGVETPQLARVRLSALANHCDADPMELFGARCKADITVVEKSRGFRHLFTESLCVGEPDINLVTGEVTGMEFASDSYSRTSA